MCDTTLDDESASQHVTFVLVTALGNQPVHFSDGTLYRPEAFASDLGDDQSRYFLQRFGVVFDRNIVWLYDCATLDT